jgi:prepilin-type N-terminal cleavage/methylation domain-containing protein
VNRARRVAAGFTLLEVAVAIAILGVGIVTVLRIFSGSLHLQDRASRSTRVVLHARAAMDGLLFQPEITDQDRELPTTAEGFRTHVLVRHAGPDEGVEKRDLDTHNDMALRYLQISVDWQDGSGVKTYTLKSLRWAPEND